MRVTGTMPMVLLLAVAGCGRREAPAWFDGRTSSPVLAVSGRPLPAAAQRVIWRTPEVPRTIDANAILQVTVSFTNAGTLPWPNAGAANPQLRDGSYAVRLTHEWMRADDPHDDHRAAERTDLPRSVMPGESIAVPVAIRAPAQPGEYRLVIELVQELVQWFADSGAERLTLPVRVVPAGAAAAGTPPAR